MVLFEAMGAVVGGALGTVFANLIKRNTPEPPRQKALLGVQVTFMTTSSEFYVPLLQFHERYITYKEERDVFEAAVAFYDKFCGIKAMFYRPDGTTASSLEALKHAEMLLSKGQSHLEAIIKFSDARAASPTKRGDMETLVTEIVNVGKTRMKQLYALSSVTI